MGQAEWLLLVWRRGRATYQGIYPSGPPIHLFHSQSYNASSAASQWKIKRTVLWPWVDGGGGDGWYYVSPVSSTGMSEEEKMDIYQQRKAGCSIEAEHARHAAHTRTRRCISIWKPAAVCVWLQCVPWAFEHQLFWGVACRGETGTGSATWGSNLLCASGGRQIGCSDQILRSTRSRSNRACPLLCLGAAATRSSSDE